MSPAGLFTMSALSRRHEANMCPVFIFVLTLRQEKDACVPSRADRGLCQTLVCVFLVSRWPCFTVGWHMDTLIRCCWVPYRVSREFLRGGMKCVFLCSKIMLKAVWKSCQRAQRGWWLHLQCSSSPSLFQLWVINTRQTLCSLSWRERTHGAAALGQTVFQLNSKSWQPHGKGCYRAADVLSTLTEELTRFNLSSGWEYFDRWRFAFQHAQCCFIFIKILL